MDIILTVILIIVFFQFLPIILVVSGVIHIFAGNIGWGIGLVIVGLLLGGGGGD